MTLKMPPTSVRIEPTVIPSRTNTLSVEPPRLSKSLRPSRQWHRFRQETSLHVGGQTVGVLHTALETVESRDIRARWD